MFKLPVHTASLESDIITTRTNLGALIQNRQGINTDDHF